MRDHIHYFAGRGKEQAIRPDPYRCIQCSDGTVLAIIHVSHSIEFIRGYCRRALYDKWGLCCHDPFRRASNAALTCSWAEPICRDLFIFVPTRLEIVKEQEWMRGKR